MKTIKLILIGDTNVGKSTILYRYKYNNNFLLSHLPQSSTIGIDFDSTFISHKDNLFKLSIWDTGGQERYRNISNMFYRNINIVLIVFSFDDKKSFDNLEYWVNQCNHHIDNNFMIFIIGNKSDIYNKKVFREEIDLFIQKTKYKFYKVNCLDHNKISELFINIINNYFEKQKRIDENDSDILIQKNKNIELNLKHSKKKCCKS